MPQTSPLKDDENTTEYKTTVQPPKKKPTKAAIIGDKIKQLRGPFEKNCSLVCGFESFSLRARAKFAV